VEALVNEKHGGDYLKQKKLKKELSQINKEFKILKTEIASLEQRKIELLVSLGE
jgi:hypothetical protein